MIYTNIKPRRARKIRRLNNYKKMAYQDCPAVNENPNQNPNQAQGNAQDDNQGQYPSPHNPFLPNAHIAPGAPQRSQLNWSHFKPEFVGKPEEDAEAHLLRTNDWMDTHNFLDHIKVQNFCLTLVGESRLWYESIRLINAEWDNLQHMFRQQYSKIGNTREVIPHMEIISFWWKCGNHRCLHTLY